MTKEIRWEVFRVFFFAVLSYDTFCSQEVAVYHDHPFKASHIDLLYDALPQWLIPGRLWIILSAFVSMFFCFMCMFGIFSWHSAELLLLTYSHCYFSSRLDAYQHHFLLCILLALIVISNPSEYPGLTEKLIRLSVGSLYFFTALTKITPMFLTGEVLKRHMAGEIKFLTTARLAVLLGIQEDTIWTVVSVVTVITELYLCFHWLSNRYGWIPWLVGTMLHISIEMCGFNILLFSYYMVVLYIWLMPESLVKRLHNKLFEKA